MKTLFFEIRIFLIVLLLSLMGCNKDEEKIPDGFIKAFVPNDTLYRAIYKDCFNEVIWVQVLNNETLGKTVEIYTPAPVHTPSPPINYSNIIQIPLHSYLKSTNQQFHLNKIVYLKYRDAQQSEIEELLDSDCDEVYNFFDIPLVIPTELILKTKLSLTLLKQ